MTASFSVAPRREEPGDAALAEMISDAVALVTNYLHQPEGSRPEGTTEADMLWSLIHERSGDEFVESFRVVQGLLGVITVLTDWYAQATGISPKAAIQQVARENEKRRP